MHLSSTKKKAAIDLKKSAVFFLGLIFSFFLHSELNAKDLEKPKGPGAQSRTVTMTIEGEIKPDLIPKVKEAIAMTTGDPLPAGLIVLLNSQGGDG